MIGKRVGPYLIVEEIGDGGHAFVFKGMKDEEAVAVKMLKPSAATEDNIEKRFMNEVEALKTLAHPNIVGFKDYIYQPPYHYLILEYMDAGAADHLLRTMGPLDSRYAVPIFHQVLQGIIHAHSFGYLHRDVKPNNILLNKKGQAKVSDFGIAKVLGGGEQLTRKGFVLGTTAYMAPEYLTMGRDTEQLDVYALGITFYELVTARKPFEFEREDEPVASFVARVAKGSPTPPSSFRPIPAELERIILRAIEADPKKRYKTAEKLREDLDAAFPDLVERPILIQAGRAQTNLLAIPATPSQDRAKAAAGTGGQRSAFSGRDVPLLLAAIGAGLIAFLSLLMAAKLDMPVSAVAGLVVIIGGFFGLRAATRGSGARERRPASTVAPPPRPAVAQPEPTAISDVESSDRVPFASEYHRNTPAKMTDISELSAFLVVTVGSEKGKRFGLRPVSRIGRDLRFDIRPHDAEISRQHACITFDGAQFTVKDVGSANGTFLNEKRITGETVINDGDIVRVGRTSMVFEHKTAT